MKLAKYTKKYAEIDKIFVKNAENCYKSMNNLLKMCENAGILFILHNFRKKYSEFLCNFLKKFWILGLTLGNRGADAVINAPRNYSILLSFCQV